MTDIRRSNRMLARTAAAVVALGLGVGFGAGIAAPAPSAAVGAGTVSVTLADDPSRTFVADVNRPTTLNVSGSGFQSVEGGVGGLYVLFGWIAGAGWEPSGGGESGVTYRYVADDPDAPRGTQLFVPFPGSSTAGEGNGGVLAADGTWASQLTIEGSSFSPVDAAGSGETIDCTAVQCGIITIGAHGVVSPPNETFTPIDFVDLEAVARDAPNAGAIDTGADAADAADAATTAESRSARETTPHTQRSEAMSQRESSDGFPWIAIGGGVAVIALIAVATVIVVRRRSAVGP